MPSCCVAERDPCEQLPGGNTACSYACEVVNGAAQCYCQSGYQLAADQVSCVGEKGREGGGSERVRESVYVCEREEREREREGESERASERERSVKETVSE